MNEHRPYRNSAVFRRIQQIRCCIDTHVRSEGCLGKQISQDSGGQQSQFKEFDEGVWTFL